MSDWYESMLVYCGTRPIPPRERQVVRRVRLDGKVTALAAAFVAGAEATADLAASFLTTTQVSEVGLGLGGLSLKGIMSIGLRLPLKGWARGWTTSVGKTYRLLCDDAISSGHLHGSLLLGLLGGRHVVCCLGKDWFLVR